LLATGLDDQLGLPSCHRLLGRSGSHILRGDDCAGGLFKRGNNLKGR
jgi:hypothetical protein